MELATRIREHRTRLGLSQDDLAQRIYVSRQTISNWETDKTYPDVQSLLLLSSQFDTSIDELIKGDVNVMEHNVKRDLKTFNALGYTMLGFTLAAIASVVWLVWQDTRGLDWTVPIAVLALVLWGCAMAAGIAAERIKKRNDLITYQEILAFTKGEPVDRDNPRSRRVRTHGKAWPYVKFVIALGVGAIAGGIAGHFLFILLH